MDRGLKVQAGFHPVLGNVGAVFSPLPDGHGREIHTPSQDFPAAGRGEADEGVQQLRLAVALHAGDGENLPGPHPEAHILKFIKAHAVPGTEVLHHQPGLRLQDCQSVQGLELRRLAHHQPGQLLGVGVLFQKRPLGLPPAEDGDVIGDLHHLFELVGDDNDGLVLPGHAPEHGEELLALQGRQHCRRLVQDEDLRAPAQGL